jgi:dynein light chain LC8-type
MPDDILEDAVTVAKKAMKEHENFEEEAIMIAEEVKKFMDEKWEPFWHVFLGKSFGCHTVHEKNRFVYFTFEDTKVSFLIYKSS